MLKISQSPPFVKLYFVKLNMDFVKTKRISSSSKGSFEMTPDAVRVISTEPFDRKGRKMTRNTGVVRKKNPFT